MKNKITRFALLFSTIYLIVIAGCGSSASTDVNNSNPEIEKTAQELAEVATIKQDEKKRNDSLEIAREIAKTDSLKRLAEQIYADSINYAYQMQLAAQQAAQAEEQARINALLAAQEAQRIANENAAIEANRVAINRNRKIRVTMVDLVCEMSDDEGAGNDADMDQFSFTVTASQNGCGNGMGGSIAQGNSIYNYDSDSRTLSEGETWYATNQSIEITYNNEDCPLSGFVLSISGKAREQDNGSSSKDEHGSNSFELYGGDIFGTHAMNLSSADFRYRCTFTIEKIGW
jgi:hypothetical protein